MRHRVCKRDRLLVEHGGPATGQAQHRFEAASARRPDGGGVAPRDRVLLRERHHRPRPGYPQRLWKLAGSHPLHERPGHRDVERGVVGERFGNDVEEAQ